MNVLVAGGSGFVGRSLCRALAERGHEVTAASRSPGDPRLPGGVATAALDVTRPDLEPVVAGHDAVVNLVALPSHVEPRGRSHRAVHLDGTCHLVAAAERTGVERFVQLSGLGVDAGVETAYFRAKRRAERVVRESSLARVIYRPSVVFGDGCAFLPFLRRVVPPVVAPLPGGGRMRIQPLWVEDLAPMLAAGLEDERHVGRTYELGGPEALTLAETVRQVCGDRIVVPIPMPLATVAFAAAEYVPGLPVGRDQCRVFALDNTTDGNDATAFGVDPADLATLGDYLRGDLDGSAAVDARTRPTETFVRPGVAVAGTPDRGGTTVTALFERALGGAWDDLHPRIRDRYGLVAAEDRVAVGTGEMRRLRRHPLALPVLRLAARDDFLFSEAGRDVPFAITTEAFVDADGYEALFLRREFETAPPRTFVDTLRWNPARDCVADCLGRTGRLVTDLHLREVDGALALDIGRQWLRVRGRYLPVPGPLAVEGRLRDRYDDAAGAFRVAASVRNPFLGEIVGYRGRFENAFEPTEPGATTESALGGVDLPGAEP